MQLSIKRLTRVGNCSLDLPAFWNHARWALRTRHSHSSNMFIKQLLYATSPEASREMDRCVIFMSTGESLPANDSVTLGSWGAMGWGGKR